MKEKENKIKFRYLWIPFKYLFKGIWFVVKGIYNLATKTKEERNKLRIKPRNPPVYKGFHEYAKISGDIKDFYSLINSDSKIGIILGGRGSGKSVLGMRILENIRAETNKKVYTMGFDEKKLPGWIEEIEDISSIHNNSFLLVDEGGINFSSRSSMSSANKLLSDLLLISRHKGISIVFITQNSSNIEVNTLRQADYLLLKPSSLLQLDFERKKIKDIYLGVNEHFRKYPDKGTTYIYSDVYRGFVKNELPNFWSEGLSKSYAKAKLN